MNKKFLLPFILVLQIFYTTARADEITPKTPSSYVVNLIDNLNSIHNDNNNNDNDIKTKITNVINHEYDFEWASRYAIGRALSSFSDEQKKLYTENFHAILSESISKSLSLFSPKKYTITVANSSEKIGKQYHSVDIDVVNKNAEQFKMILILKDFEGVFKIINFKYESVDFVLSYKTQFSEIIESNGRNIDKFLDTLKSQLKSMESK